MEAQGRRRLTELLSDVSAGRGGACEALGVSHATVERDWRNADAWLTKELAEEEP